MAATAATDVSNSNLLVKTSIFVFSIGGTALAIFLFGYFADKNTPMSFFFLLLFIASSASSMRNRRGLHNWFSISLFAAALVTVFSLGALFNLTLLNEVCYGVVSAVVVSVFSLAYAWKEKDSAGKKAAVAFNINSNRSL
ncbi:MAG: hypothetical protein NWF05_05570 [Candidatus Bathyarchaeota archaeon]|nr:hypothetical protein [Candidatus Bathyarchaeota archaeon]